MEVWTSTVLKSEEFNVSAPQFEKIDLQINILISKIVSLCFSLKFFELDFDHIAKTGLEDSSFKLMFSNVGLKVYPIMPYLSSIF